MDEQLHHLRVEYDATSFHARDAGEDPMLLFRAWFADATDRAEVVEANAMSLATTTATGTPSVRMVLLKGLDPARATFTWYTNLESRKAREALTTGIAALCWWWPGVPGRQVRAVGRVEQLPRAESAAYFASRPHAAQVGALASRQSRAVHGRTELEARAASIGSGDVHLPDAWGGLRLVADELEFWQGRLGRLHDRIAFLRLDDAGRPCSEAAVAAAGGAQQLRASGTEVVDTHGTRWLRVRLEP